MGWGLFSGLIRSYPHFRNTKSVYIEAQIRHLFQPQRNGRITAHVPRAKDARLEEFLLSDWAGNQLEGKAVTHWDVSRP